MLNHSREKKSNSKWAARKIVGARSNKQHFFSNGHNLTSSLESFQFKLLVFSLLRSLWPHYLFLSYLLPPSCLSLALAISLAILFCLPLFSRFFFQRSPTLLVQFPFLSSSLPFALKSTLMCISFMKFNLTSVEIGQSD